MEENRNMEEGQEVKKRNEGDNDRTIFIGNKPLMNYVTGVVMQFTTLKRDEVIVKARGKFISKAVDVAQVSMKRFLDNKVEIERTMINSEEFTNKEGRQVRVSTIEVYMKKL